MATAHNPPTGRLPIIDARGQRSLVERMLFGPSERPDQNSRWHQRITDPQIPGLVSAVTLLFGIWLAMTPLIWDHTGGSVLFTASGWNEVLAGLALAALGMARLTRPIRLVAATALGGSIGGWLIVAPFVFDYGLGSGSTPATINDVVVGLTVAAITVVGYVDARQTASTAADFDDH